MTRSRDIDEFLVRAGWAGAVRAPLAGDASFRRYERVHLNGKVAVLMDAPPEKEDTAPFIRVDEYLESLGCSVPLILAADTKQGFLLLEDLGDSIFTRVLAGDTGGSEKELYLCAAQVLLEFHRTKSGLPAILPLYDTALLMREVALLSEWFLPLAFGEEKATALSGGYLSLWQKVIEDAALPTDYFVHRDFHADNLLFLPERAGFAQCGMLDFQDAVRGSAAYDMVSFLEDARRDVAPSTVDAVIAYYLHETGADKAEFMRQYAILGAQRNCKIIGIFCRLAKRDNKPHYLSLLPRVWAHLEHDVQHPALHALKEWLQVHVPLDARKGQA